MKINLEINNLSKNPIADAFFISVAKETLADVNLDFIENKNICVSLAIVNEKEIRKLNKQYRKVDKATDVLSFPEFSNRNALKKNTENELFLGEIILCYDDIKKYATKESLEFKKELAKVFAHGILHLLGFQHGEKMFTLQEKIAKNFSK